MKFAKSIVASILAGWLAVASPSYGEDNQGAAKSKVISLHATTDILSKYVLRGYSYSEKPVMQETLTASYNDVSLIGFMNYDLDTRNLNELDLTMDITKRIGSATWSAGYTLLSFPNSNYKKTQEIYAEITLDTLLNPQVKVYHDFDEGRGTYAELSCRHMFGSGQARVSASAALGYNRHYYRARSGLSHAEFRLSLPVQANEKVAITPFIDYSKSLDKDFQDELFGGVSISLGF